MSGILDNKLNRGRPRALFEFTQGIEVDQRLASSEIRVQRAWIKAIGSHKNLSNTQVDSLLKGLDEAQELILSGRFDWRVEDEDIHMNLERFLTERVGPLAKQIHEGRSRNDLIATTLRLFVEEQATDLISQILGLVKFLTQNAERDIDILIAGMTHLQNAQPLRMSQVWLAHAQAFKRDCTRLKQVADRAKAAMPLGAAALAGSTVALDFEKIANELGFANVCQNSLDAVGDRDFMVDFLYAISQFGVHLSRLSEDVIYWSSGSVGLMQLSKAWSTGSSIMPNKRNPDVAELSRAKAAHLIGGVSNGLALMKGLPSSYQSDLHELKSVVIRSCDIAQDVLAVFGEFISGITVDRMRASELLNRGHLLATEIANELARVGTPFREAYSKTAHLVELANQRGVQVETLSYEEISKVAPELSVEFLRNLSFESAVEKRESFGGTSRAQVLKAIRSVLENRF